MDSGPAPNGASRNDEPWIRRYNSAFSRRHAPELSMNLRPNKTEGAGKAGCLVHPQPRVQCRIAHGLVTTGSPRTPGLPCAIVLTTYAAISPATNSSCHRHRRQCGVYDPGRVRNTSADLTPATGARTTRFTRPRPVFAKRLRRALPVYRSSGEGMAPFVCARRSLTGNPPCDHLSRPTLPRPPASHPA